MANTMLETRLITINSSQRSIGGGETTTSFTVDLLGCTPEIRNNVVGVSVETVGFVNLIENVDERYNYLYVERDGITYDVVIEPGQYDYVTLAATITQALNIQLGYPVDTFQAIPKGEEGGQPALIELKFDEVQSITILGLRDSLSHILGIPTGFNIELGDGLPNPIFRPNLYGPMAVLLQTRALAGSRNSVNGTGQPSPTLMTIPLRGTYGSVENMHMGGEDRPLVVYSKGADRNLNNIDVSLTHLDGSPVNLGETGEMYVTFRVWIRHM